MLTVWSHRHKARRRRSSSFFERAWFSTHIRSPDCAFGWLREIRNAPSSDDVSAGLLVHRVGNVVAYFNRTYARTVGRSR